MKYLTCDITDLRLLVDLCSTHSLKTTGTNLNLSAPAVSRRLQVLRQTLPLDDDPLFVRSGNDFLPTARMKETLPELKKSIASFGKCL